MIDIKLTPQNGVYDFDYGDDGDFIMEDGFDTALLMGVFCERRATPEEVPDAIRRSGWIGNLFYNENGFENGSKVWLHISQGRIIQETLNNVRDAAQKGLDYLVQDELAQSVSTEIEVVSGKPELKIRIEYSSSRVDERYYDVWGNTG